MSYLNRMALPSPTDDPSGFRESLRAYSFASRMTRRSAMPLVLVLAMIATHGAFLALAPRTAQGELHPLALLLGGAKVNALVLDGEVWRLVASVFLHADWTHLAVNGVGALVLAQLADNVFGWARTLVFFLVSGIAGAALSTFVSPEPSIGASGAVYGLLGAMAAFAIQRRARVPSALRGSLVVSMLIWLAVSVGYGFVGTTIDNAAHAGGLVAGALMALASGTELPIFRTGPLHTSVPWRAAAVACALAVAASAVMSVRGLDLDFDIAPPALAPLAMSGVHVPFPTLWRHGAAENATPGSIDCRAGDDAYAEALAAGLPVCARDPYGTLLFLGRGGDLIAGYHFDPNLTLEFGQRRLIEVRSGNVTRRLLMLNRELALVLVAYDEIATKYEPTLAAVLDGVRFAGQGQ